MKVEVIGLAARRLEEGQGLAPGIAGFFAAREVVQGTQTDKIPAGNRGLARPECSIARDLGKPGTFGNRIDEGHLEAGSRLATGRVTAMDFATAFMVGPKIARL